jgi:hypothetical protein
MPRYLLLFGLFWLSATLVQAQEKNNGKCIVSIVDSMQLSPSFQLTFYWWDPYHPWQGKKMLSPLNVDESSFFNQAPPYTYDFKLKKGPTAFYILSCFNDTLHFNFELQNDTIIDFQKYVHGFYEVVDTTVQIFDNRKPQDLYTIYLAKIFNQEREGLRLDLVVDSLGQWQILAIDRKIPDLKKQPIDLVKLAQLLEQIEPAAKALSSPDENGYIVTLRKNRQVIEYNGKVGGGNINGLLVKLKKCCLVE